MSKTSKKAWRAAKLGDIPPLKDSFMQGWHSVRHHLGIEAFGVNAVTKDKGGILIMEHSEAGSGQQELFFVSQGGASFSIDGEKVDVLAGTFLAIDPKPLRSAVALKTPTSLIIIGAKPGEAYAVPNWDKLSQKNT